MSEIDEQDARVAQSTLYKDIPGMYVPNPLQDQTLTPAEWGSPVADAWSVG